MCNSAVVSIERYEFPYPSPAAVAEHPFDPLDFRRYSSADMAERADDLHQLMDRRRSVRMLSDEPVPVGLIEAAVRTASTAPSGAHQQPWQFIAISDPATKREIRLAAEAEERINYEEHRMNDAWQHELAPLGTDWHKEFLEIAPWIVVLFEERYGIRDDGPSGRTTTSRRAAVSPQACSSLRSTTWD